MIMIDRVGDKVLVGLAANLARARRRIWTNLTNVRADVNRSKHSRFVFVQVTVFVVVVVVFVWVKNDKVHVTGIAIAISMPIEARTRACRVSECVSVRENQAPEQRALNAFKILGIYALSRTIRWWKGASCCCACTQ
jgi:hypothetical protein